MPDAMPLVMKRFLRLALHMVRRSATRLICAAAVFWACAAQPSTSTVGLTLTGLDHLPAEYSIQDFSVDDTGGAQAGKGGRQVCCVSLPLKWTPGLTVKVAWGVTNWPKRIYSLHEQTVPVEPYTRDELGSLYIHFLRDGSVRAVVSMYAPYGDHYKGPAYDTVLRKQPWTDYKRAPGEPEFKQVEDAREYLHP